jgi:hypothetical protein
MEQRFVVKMEEVVKAPLLSFPEENEIVLGSIIDFMKQALLIKRLFEPWRKK